MLITNKQLSAWTKGIEVQRAQAAEIKKLSEVKDFDEINARKHKQNGMKLHACVNVPTGEKCKYCGSSHAPRQCLAYGKKFTKCNKMNHFREVCRGARGSVVHDIEQESDQKQENHIEMVNINFINFNPNHSVIAANLKTSSNKAITVPYKGDAGSDGSIMPLCVFKKLFPRARKEQLAGKRNTNIKLKMCNWTTIIQLGICKVKIEHKNKQNSCTFFVVPGNGQVLLGIPRIEILNIPTINCNAIGTKETEMLIAIQTQPSPRVQKVKNTIQIQGEKLDGQEDAI